MGFFRPTYAEINLSALERNFKKVRALLPAKTGIMAMIKADAYGHGSARVATRLESCGVTSFGVATVEEGVELRDAGIKSPVVVMGGLMGMGSPASGMMVGADLTPVINSVDVLDFLEAVSKAARKVIGVHLKIDSGMGRLGVLPDGTLDRVISVLKECRHIKLTGLMTHFAEAEDRRYTKHQMDVFMKAAEKVEREIGPVAIWHMANSAALMDGNCKSVKGREIWVRPGLSLFGAYPSEAYRKRVSLEPVMSLKSSVVLIKTVPAGTNVSYGCTYTTKERTRLGIVPMGYADGYPWSLSNKAEVLIGGKRFPVAGRVTMDMIVIDLGFSDVHVGDEVVLLGRQGDDQITADELAGLAGTISYEIFCGISKRMPRVYVG